jgi:CheY-like chemotaxis protein
MKEKIMPHVLVIEDDDFFSATLAHMLTQDGHQVSICTNGAQALAQLPTIQPDLIITDILMPHMDGVEFILALSRQDRPTPLIAMSGGRRSISPAFNLESARLVGAKATLTKPFSLTDLRNAVREALA